MLPCFKHVRLRPATFRRQSGHGALMPQSGACGFLSILNSIITPTFFRESKMLKFLKSLFAPAPAVSPVSVLPIKTTGPDFRVIRAFLRTEWQTSISGEMWGIPPKKMTQFVYRTQVYINGQPQLPLIDLLREPASIVNELDGIYTFCDIDAEKFQSYFKYGKS